MVKKKRNYRREIIAILEKHGEISGFNELCKIGNFHRTSLQNNLDSLGSNEIIITKGYGKTIYSLPALDYELIFSKLFPNVVKLEIKYNNQEGKTKINTTKKLIKELSSQKTSIDFILSEILSLDLFGKKYTFLKVIQNKLESRLRNYQYSLSIKHRLEAFDYAVPFTSTNLKTCRKIWKKYDIS